MECSAETGHNSAQTFKENSASLSRALLSLSSFEIQQRALHCILYSMQIQLCRDAVVGMFCQSTILKDNSVAQSQLLQDESEVGTPNEHRDWTKFIKDKETAALWELLKLSTTQSKEFFSDSQATLSDALLGTKFDFSLKIFP